MKRLNSGGSRISCWGGEEAICVCGGRGWLLTRALFDENLFKNEGIALVDLRVLPAHAPPQWDPILSFFAYISTDKYPHPRSVPPIMGTPESTGDWVPLEGGEWLGASGALPWIHQWSIKPQKIVVWKFKSWWLCFHLAWCYITAPSIKYRHLRHLTFLLDFTLASPCHVG